MNAFRRGDEYVFALTYGSDVQWVKNIMAAGECRLVTRGRTLRLIGPRLFRDPQRSLMPKLVRPFLDGDRDDLDKLVGKQVRVSGTIEKRSDLNDHNASGTVKDRDRTKIDDGDLAQVKVASVTSIGSACGGKAGRTKK